MLFLYIALYPPISSEPRYMVQGAMGNQCTIPCSVYCQVLILRLSEPEQISGTNLCPGTLGSEVKTKCMAGLEPTILWLRVQCLDHSVNSPPNRQYFLTKLTHARWHMV